MLLRRNCLEQIGGLDRDFFLYYEDVDLCQRARARGWSVWYEPELRATHHHPLHQRAVPAYLRVLTRHALMTYAAKHWPAWQTQLLAGLVGWEARLRQLWATQKKDVDEVALYRMLRAIALEMGEGRATAARRWLEQVVRGEGNQRAP
jgi:GT2 family glycosyltransferase